MTSNKDKITITQTLITQAMDFGKELGIVTDESVESIYPPEKIANIEGRIQGALEECQRIIKHFSSEDQIWKESSRRFILIA